jgi:hypothetical protein
MPSSGQVDHRTTVEAQASNYLPFRLIIIELLTYYRLLMPSSGQANHRSSGMSHLGLFSLVPKMLGYQLLEYYKRWGMTL